ncbi:F-box domain protein [Penicillium taxi]|uniref:F-box domain protein n=1 Tax=Penicillium taxi TaxID=168475 RepID=UPI0025456A49|nr:F-box domain protein [Penicillium taxi]KAJ5902710.1 F-box domain protein [Penicillium taxi]
MQLTNLPNEILAEIAHHTLPQGFENFKATCKHTHEICAPLTKRHNYMCEHAYFSSKGQSAFTLIDRITATPILGRYIEYAYLRKVSLLRVGHDGTRLPEDYTESEQVLIKTLFAKSSFLKEVGLDWEKYYAQISSEMCHHRLAVPERRSYGYSQHAFMFLLTLLPNLKVLELPTFWHPTTSDQKPIETMVDRARQIHPHRQPILSNLSDIIFEGLSEYMSTAPYSLPDDKLVDLVLVTPFLALPNLRHFRYSDCIAYDYSQSISKYLPDGFESSLESLHLTNANVSATSISQILKHTPHLKIMHYNHRYHSSDRPEFGLWPFIQAVESEVGAHLEELSLSVVTLALPLPTPRFGEWKQPARSLCNLHGFKKLQRLELPQQMPIYKSYNEYESRIIEESILSDMVPPSVSRLSVRGNLMFEEDEKFYRAKVDIIFGDFASQKDLHFSALEGIALVETVNNPRTILDLEKLGVKVWKFLDHLSPINWTEEEHFRDENW